MRRRMMMVALMALLPTSIAFADTGPHYDVPAHFTRCPRAVAWNGFFKWASERNASCHAASHFMRVYAAHASGPRMPHHVAGYSCRIHYWRNADGDIYASRHTCTRGRETIRFYGMV
jgi:hypothetical protein